MIARHHDIFTLGSGITYRVNRRDKGQRILGHCHNFDHDTAFFSRWRLWAWDRQVDAEGNPLMIEAVVGLDREGKPVVQVVQSWQMVLDGKLCISGELLHIRANRKHMLESDEGNGLAICIYPNRAAGEDHEIVTYETGWAPAFDVRPDGPQGFDPHPATWRA